MKYFFYVAVFLLTLTIQNQVVADSSLSGDNSVKVDSIKVLVFSGTGWYRHSEIPLTNGWLARLGAEHNMQINITETPGDISEESIQAYDVLLLNNANELDNVLNREQRMVIQQWYREGGGIVGLHAALVHQQGWPWLLELGGCDFKSDSNFQKAKVMVDPQAQNHQTIKGYGPEFWYSADWHNHTRSVTGLKGVQVLLRVDESTYDPVRDHFKEQGAQPMGKDHPVSWIRRYDGGRFFYTELGHDLRSLDTPFGRTHIIEGIRWVAKK